MKKSVEIIAEIGNTHDGSLGQLKNLITEAKNSGANTVKIQTHFFEDESLPTAPNPSYFNEESRENYFKRTSFNKIQYQEIISFCKKNKINFLSSVFSIKALKFLSNLGLKRIKIPSGELSNWPLIEASINSGKNIILSTGMSSQDELDSLFSKIRQKQNKNITLMQCTSAYPCGYDKVNIQLISKFKKIYQCKVGFSDHTLGISAPLFAVFHGAEVIEKHFTLSKKMYGSDAKNSMEPNEFKYMVDSIREAEVMINSNYQKKIDKNLKNMKIVFEKSIVSNINLKKDTIIKKNMITLKKPGNGLNSKYIPEILGKKTKKNIPKNTILKLRDFK